MLTCINCNKAASQSQRPIYQSDNISVFGQEDFERIQVSNNRVLFLWGAVYGILLPNGNYISISLKTQGPEILANLFSNYTLDEAIDKIEGNFIGLLISNNKEAVIFGDQFTRKELFYSRTEQGIVASTKLKEVIERIDSIKYSQNVLVNLLTVYGYYAPKKHTIYENIQRLGVGEKLNVSSSGVLIEKKPFKPQKIRQFDLKEHETYVDIMKSAVESRASSGCNWVFMSSGFDSSAILSLLVDRYGAGKVRCVIGRMKYSERSGIINQYELDRATKISDYFGVAIDQIDFDLTKPSSVSFWEDLAPRLKDQHLYAYSAYNYYRLAQHVDENGNSDDAVFVGSISDGAHNFGFAQFATILEHPDLGFREYSDKMASYLFGPSFLNRVLQGESQGDFVYDTIKKRSGDAEFDDPSGMTEHEKKINYLASFFHRNRRVPFYGRYNSKLATRNGLDAFENEMKKVYLEDIADKLTPDTVYSCMLYLYNSYYWQGSTERSMTAGLLDFSGKTITPPFWDGRLQRFLSEMPENWGRGLELRPTKYPLKWMLQNAVDYPLHLQVGPHSYQYDVNPQFSHTSEFLFGSGLKPHLQKCLEGHAYEQILEPAHFNLDYINSVVDDYLQGNEFGGAKMNDLLPIVNLCLIGWY